MQALAARADGAREDKRRTLEDVVDAERQVSTQLLCTWMPLTSPLFWWRCSLSQHCEAARVVSHACRMSLDNTKPGTSTRGALTTRVRGTGQVGALYQLSKANQDCQTATMSLSTPERGPVGGLHAQILLWERRIQLHREMRAAIDPAAGAAGTTALAKEVRCQIRRCTA